MKERQCGTCGGTGWQWLNRSWFASDGLRKERCGICGGSGRSDYRDSTDFVRSQKALRARAEELAKLRETAGGG